MSTSAECSWAEYLVHEEQRALSAWAASLASGPRVPACARASRRVGPCSWWSSFFVFREHGGGLVVDPSFLIFVFYFHKFSFVEM